MKEFLKRWRWKRANKLLELQLHQSAMQWQITRNGLNYVVVSNDFNAMFTNFTHLANLTEAYRNLIAGYVDVNAMDGFTRQNLGHLNGEIVNTIQKSRESLNGAVDMYRKALGLDRPPAPTEPVIEDIEDEYTGVDRGEADSGN